MANLENVKQVIASVNDNLKQQTEDVELSVFHYADGICIDVFYTIYSKHSGEAECCCDTIYRGVDFTAAIATVKSFATGYFVKAVTE